MERIIDLLPATGWRIYSCSFYAGQHIIEELAVVAWGLADDGAVELVVLDSHQGILLSAYESQHNAVSAILPPGLKFTAQARTKLIAKARASKRTAAAS